MNHMKSFSEYNEGYKDLIAGALMSFGTLGAVHGEPPIEKTVQQIALPNFKIVDNKIKINVGGKEWVYELKAKGIGIDVLDIKIDPNMRTGNLTFKHPIFGTTKSQEIKRPAIEMILNNLGQKEIKLPVEDKSKPQATLILM